MTEKITGSTGNEEITGLESIQTMEDLKAAQRVDIHDVDTSGTGIKFREEISGFTIEWKVDRTPMMNFVHLVLPVISGIFGIILSILMLIYTEGGISWWVIEFWLFVLGAGAIVYSVLKKGETYVFVMDIDKLSMIRKFIFTSRVDLDYSLIKRIEVLISPNANLFGTTLSLTTREERIQIDGHPKAIGALELLMKEMLRIIKRKRKELGLGDTMTVVSM